MQSTMFSNLVAHNGRDVRPVFGLPDQRHVVIPKGVDILLLTYVLSGPLFVVGLQGTKCEDGKLSLAQLDQFLTQPLVLGDVLGELFPA